MRAREIGPVFRVAILGGVTLCAYALVDLSEGAIARNGLRIQGIGAAPDRVALAGQLGLFLAANLVLFWAYVQVLAMSRRGALAAPRARLLAFAFAVLFNLGMAARAPRLSQDVYSYMAHGYLAEVPGSNPLLRSARMAMETDIGPRLAALGWTGEAGITPYGVLWTRLEMAVMHATHDVGTARLAWKGLALLASFACAFCIWQFAGRTAPASQLTATLAYLWNPLFVVEFAGEGHNDALMVALVLASLVAAAARRPVAAGIALLLGVLTKYVPLLLAPPHLVYEWRTGRDAARLARAVVLALGVAAGIAAALYAPIWAGADSLRGLAQRAESSSSASLFGIANWILIRSPLHPVAGRLAMVLLMLPTLAFVLWRSARIADAGSLARGCAWISFAYLLGAAPDYWPWYSAMPVALLLAGYVEENLGIALFISLCARLIAPLNAAFLNGAIGMRVAKGLTTFVGATLPLVVAGIWAIRSARRALASSAEAAPNCRGVDQTRAAGR
jgi:alpha-1,6-mannosyltransferase